MYDVRQKNLHWQSQWLKFLTPLHLKMKGEIPYKDPISKALLIHQVNLIILYTAYRTKGTENNPTSSTYVSANQSVELTFENSLDQIGSDIIANATDLMEILEWVYDIKWSGDRIGFIQTVATQYLHAVSPVTRYQMFFYNTKNILNELKWHWQAFIDGKVDNYTSQVQMLEDYVANTVQKFADQITGMNKSLSDTMLAAVGALIGSFIAALFKTTFNPQIFKIGMLAYAVYVLFFPLIYNMIYQWEQYKTICNNCDVRKKRFQERLYPDKVNEIVGKQITDSEKRFKRWFFTNIAIYLIIAVLAIFSAFWLPGFIQDTTFSIQNVTISST
ncbi:hypothetical protein [Methanosarcina sp. 1.H.A.2.2]|uniref:hypothetical protein n=1 Tax=Methanosarcina sp. 1.H.A.2.2 TaxID=1483601 RepID=UPI0006219605|nr:hypothetical protein [Methanosarcina sp. 1.H.A.2.2]KKH47757.1 hypothetical protein EO93_13515 [Methanosarcina sp. 1.H.A.2.2]